MIEMVSTGTLKRYDKYDSGDHMFQAITKPTIEESIASLKAYLAPSVIEFTNKLKIELDQVLMQRKLKRIDLRLIILVHVLLATEQFQV